MRNEDYSRALHLILERMGGANQRALDYERGASVKIHRNFMAAGVLSIAALGLTACGGSTDTDASPEPADEALVMVVDACEAIDDAHDDAFRDDKILWQEISAEAEANNYDPRPLYGNRFNRSERKMWREIVQRPMYAAAAATAVQAAFLDPRWEEMSEAATQLATGDPSGRVDIYCDAARALAERG